MRSTIVLVLIGVSGLIGVSAAPQPARANCYEQIGCTNSDYYEQWQLKKLSCQILWEVRNTIYKENGYCFRRRSRPSVMPAAFTTMRATCRSTPPSATM